MKTFLPYCLCCLLSFSVKGQQEILVLQNWQSQYDLQPYTSISDDIPETISLKNIAEKISTISFVNYSKYPLPTKTNKYYLGKIQIENNLPNANQFTEWIVKLSGCWTQLDLFVVQSENIFKHHQTGAFVSYKEKTFLPEMEGNFLKLYLPPGQLTTIFFRGTGERGNSLPNFRATLQHSDIYFENLKSKRKSHSLFLGFIIMMLVYNLIFYFIHSDKSYLYYSSYLFTFVVYTSFVSGDLAEWLGPLVTPNHPQYMYIFKFGAYLGLIAYTAFVRVFLDLKELLPKWYKFFNFYMWLGLPWMIIDLILMFVTNFSYVIGDSITLAYIMLFIFSNIFFIYKLFRTKDKKGYFIIVGLTAICIGITFSAIEWKWSNSFTMIYAKAASIIEIVVFSLGLAYRQWENQKLKQKINLDLAKSKIEQQQKQDEAIRLKELNQMKSNFYTNITHEFRTPLTVIQGMAEQINGKYENETRLIRRNSKNLLHLVNQMLDLSKLESGNLKLNNIQGNIITFLKTEVESYFALATSNNPTVNIHSSSNEINMDFDVQKTQQILTNLLSNAIKLLEDNGKIIIEISKTTVLNLPQLQLKISGNGIGIPKNQLPHIFNRFYQLDNSMTRKGESTCIGLALTKELIELMNGKVFVESEIKIGTTFTILLPITQNASLINIKDELQPISKSSDKNHNNTFSINQMLDNPDYPTALIIEDNEDVIQYLITCLQDDYRIITALNGKEGIRTAIEHTPDIIISDVMMPEANGFEVTDHLKNDERTSHIPIILLTAITDQESKLKGLEKGADAYLTKPFDKKELMVRLEKLIENRKKLQERYSTTKFILSTAEEQLSKEDIFLKKLRTQIETHLDNADYNIEFLAKDMNLSRQQLYRKTKALTGKSVAVYVRSLRLYYGKQLLQTTNLNISEVAYQVGFSDPSYFSKSYSEEFGYAPIEEH